MSNLRKVKSGDSLYIPASTFNAFVDAAVDHRQRQQSSAQTARDAARQTDIVLVTVEACKAGLSTPDS